MVRRKKSEKKEKKIMKDMKKAAVPFRGQASRGEKIRKEHTDTSKWEPKTVLGKRVKNREIINIDEILNNSLKILEPEIVDELLSLEQDLLLIGQSKGKFGGGSRRVFRQTQKKTREGNKPKFSTMAIVGDKNGHVGLGFGKAKETVPAREKAIRKAKLNLFKIRRGCGSWQCGCGTPHSIPFTVKGKCGSVEVRLMPAPKGKGLCCEKEIAKILELAGIRDVWTKTRGQTKNKINFIYACEDALKKLIKTKAQPEHYETLAIVEGKLPEEQNQEGGLQESAKLDFASSTNQDLLNSKNSEEAELKNSESILNLPKTESRDSESASNMPKTESRDSGLPKTKSLGAKDESLSTAPEERKLKTPPQTKKEKK